MTTHNISYVASTGSISPYALGWATGAIVSLAPILYCDFSVAATYTTWPGAVAVTVGQTIASSECYYYEVTQAGTLAASSPGTYNDMFTPDYLAAHTLVTSGTAIVALRPYQGWSRASNLAWLDGLARGDLYVYAKSTTSHISSGFQSSTVTNLRAYNGLVSVSAASDIVTSYAAGAKAYSVDTVNGNAYMIPMGLLRGISFGRIPNDSTVPSAPSPAYGATIVPMNCRAYDCTITSINGRTTVGDTYPAFMVGGTAIRCAFNNPRASSIASALFGGYVNGSQGGTIIGGTVARATSTNFVLTSVPSSMGTVTPTMSAAHPRIIGADFTGVAGTAELYQVDTATTLNPRIHSVPGPNLYGVNYLTHTPDQNKRMLAVQSSLGTSALAEVPENALALALTGAYRTNSVYRTGGASDASSAFSMKTSITDVVDNQLLDIWFFNEKVDESFIVSVEALVVVGSGTGITGVLTNDLWMDCTYLASPTNMRGGFASSLDRYDTGGMYHLTASPTYIPSSASAWTGQPANSVKIKMSCVITPRRVGPVHVFIGGAICPWTQHRYSGNSLDVYIDPRVLLEAAP